MAIKFNFLILFIILCLLSSLITWASQWILISEDMYFNAFGEQLSDEKINELIRISKDWNWIIYVVIPFIYISKLFLVAVTLFVGAFLFRFNIGLKSLFKIVLQAEFIFLLPPIIKLLWLSLVSTHYTLTDLQFFTPLSLINLFDRTGIQQMFIYPISLINLFEIIYVLFLSYLLNKETASDFTSSLKLVICSYGIGLLIWVIFVMFISVTLAV